MKKRVRLTERDLHRIVKESVNRLLREEILGTPGRKTRSFDGDVPYDDDYVEKYGSSAYHSYNDDELDDKGFETTNQTISKDVAAFLKRVDNAVTRKFGGHCTIRYGMDSEDIDRETNNDLWSCSWTDTRNAHKISFCWMNNASNLVDERISRKVFNFVTRMIMNYCPYELTISNANVSYREVDINLEYEDMKKLGRNNKINLSNKHGNSRHSSDDKFKYDEDHNAFGRFARGKEI